VCNRWRQVAGQWKIDLAPARLAVASRCEIPGPYPANLSEPTSRDLSRFALKRRIPAKNVATALGFVAALKSRPAAHQSNSVRLPLFAWASQPKWDFESRRDKRYFFRWQMTGSFAERIASASLSKFIPETKTQALHESSRDLLRSVVTSGFSCRRLRSFDPFAFGAGRNRLEFGPLLAGIRPLKTMVLAHAPNWVLADLPFDDLVYCSSFASNSPRGTTPMPAKGISLHEKRDAHQCSPTGGEPDCHR
jgi:hypothetical protein